MANNNPAGYNGFQGFGADQPYGAELKQHQLAQGAPIPGTPLTNAPQRAQRAAVRGNKQQQAQQQAQPPPAPAQPPYPVWLAQTWQAIANEPGASQMVREQAALAMQGAGLGG